MIVKIKSYFLKDGIDPSALIRYGYEKCGDNYNKELVESYFSKSIRCYGNTRRFAYVDYPVRDARSRKVKKYIADLIEDGIVELRTNYEWWQFIGSVRNLSEKKRDMIEAKLNKLNKMAMDKMEEKQ